MIYINYISKGINKKPSLLSKIIPLTLEQISKFLKEKYNIKISDKVILKLDVDSDGLISYEDMKSILKRYEVTGFFKYTNEASNPQINFYSKENLPEDKIKSIIKNLSNYMKLKNISEIGLFKKLDKNGDGFISNVEFNEELDNIIKLNPDIKDQFFNFLDYYHNGMVDLSTFISRLTNMENDYKLNYLSRNNNIIENRILEEFKLFCQNNLYNYIIISFRLASLNSYLLYSRDSFFRFSCLPPLGGGVTRVDTRWSGPPCLPPLGGGVCEADGEGSPVISYPDTGTSRSVLSYRSYSVRSGSYPFHW